MVQWITRSTYSGRVVNSDDRGLASPAKQTSIPRSGSFTEVCSVVSGGQTGLGKAGLAGLRRQGLGCRGHAANGQTTVSSAPVRFECARKSVVDTRASFIGAGAGHGIGWPLAQRGARAGVLWRAQSASNTWSFSSARVPQLTQVAKVRILAKIRCESFPGT
jgi:hypothetical protein